MGDIVISLEAGGCHLRIMPFFDRAKHVTGSEDIIEAQIEVDSGAFQGRFRVLLWPGELESLQAIFSDLYQDIRNTTERSFATFENEIQMVFRPSHLGRLQVEVEVAPSLDLGPFLRFFMEADQSYLPGWIASLDAAIRQWPTSGGVRSRG